MERAKHWRKRAEAAERALAAAMTELELGRRVAGQSHNGVNHAAPEKPMDDQAEVKARAERLPRPRRPFPASAVRGRPGRVAGQRAMALPYIDARDVMQRLDGVLGHRPTGETSTPC